MNIKDKKKNIIQAGYKAVDELIKVAKEEIVDTDEDVSAELGKVYKPPALHIVSGSVPVSISRLEPNLFITLC